ncbi:MAG: hypothetical protein WC284_16495 [Candidimonas sp.]
MTTRKIIRIDPSFEWPLRKPWDGFHPQVCQKCDGHGYVSNYVSLVEKIQHIILDEQFRSIFGNQNVFDIVEDMLNKRMLTSEDFLCSCNSGVDSSWTVKNLPRGIGYQMWDHCSPLSPIFLNLDDLIDWCVDNVSICGSIKGDKTQWSRIANGKTIMIDM